jgi:hypothetical protein
LRVGPSCVHALGRALRSDFRTIGWSGVRVLERAESARDGNSEDGNAVA